MSKLPPGQAYALGMQRESWCAVELKKEQDWCRATRKHYPQQFKSTVFSSNSSKKSADEPRCTFRVNEPTHLQRKHYHDKYTNQLKL